METNGVVSIFQSVLCLDYTSSKLVPMLGLYGLNVSTTCIENEQPQCNPSLRKDCKNCFRIFDASYMQMAEYCEGFDCRRKKLLGSFGEQVLDAGLNCLFRIAYGISCSILKVRHINFINSNRSLHHFVEKHVMCASTQT